MDAEFKTGEDVLDQFLIQLGKQLSQLAAVEETKLVGLVLGPPEQGAIHIMEKGWEVQDEPAVRGVFLAPLSHGTSNLDLNPDWNPDYHCEC